ncbi:MFS general substrate transporter [Annulohypoxylon truncatum]|uniref:MFS general substrate transporter n=1 Tax=Annulohypoxylon truncatum TaxID=327061 RepID=UPI002008AF49|nr:MFS general substrate transporter [Annulohypoxylon truncatum]KAI1209580.1 MFS general substrate transporter [Annulohypoxylon truncatum]
MAETEKPDIIPGTDIIFTDGNNGENTTPGEVVLIPQPTSSPDDPLNWNMTWKTVIIFNQFVFVFVSIMTPMAISPLSLIFEEEFHKTLPEVNMLFGAAAITLGYANFLIVPAANLWGRRPVVLVCGLICILANIWQGLVTSYPSFLGARVISGLGAAANESIMPMVVADLLFQHQRGSSMALYFWAYFLGLFIGPIISGAIASQISWRWFFWVCTILQGASFIFLLVAHPETKYDRPAPARPSTSRDSTVINVRVSNTGAVAEKSENGGSSSSSTEIANTLTTAHHRATGRPSRAQFSLLPMRKSLRFRHSYNNNSSSSSSSSGPSTPHRNDQSVASTLLRDVASPMQILFTFPIVAWASLSMGFAANSLLALNLTSAQVFGAPPYLFTPAQIGFVNFAFVAGAAVALVTAGPLSDRIALRRARKNAGVLEAEMRLPALMPYICANVAGMAVVAVGYQRAWPWEAVVIVGYTLVGLQVVGIPAVAIAYAVDSYKTLPGEVMIAATIVKNTFGFGMIFFFNDWAARSGYIKPVLMMMALTIGFSILGLCAFTLWGKQFRRWTKDSKLHSL